MQTDILTIIMLAVIAVILFSTSFAALIYKKNAKHRTILNDKNDWLFSGFQEKLFDLCYKNSSQEKLCGIDHAEYIRKCRVIHEKPDYKKVVAYRLEAIFLLIVFMFLALIFTFNLVFTTIFLMIGFTLFFLLWVYPTTRIDAKAEERLFHITDDLPRFLALMEKAMDLPIDQAMLTTAKRFDSPLSYDIIDSINKVNLGADGWQEMLMDLARVYRIEDFSDIVLDVVNSYDQGINVRPLINRKAYEVEQNRLYTVEAHDAKIKTLVYLPIIVFKVIPLMVLICLPMLSDFI